MLAVDTNLLVRRVVEDDVAQSNAVHTLFAHNEIWISKTVLLETVWVLRQSYGFEPQRVIAALRNLVGEPQVRLERPTEVAEAFDLCDGGVGFADALHLASADGARAFVTFDRQLQKRAWGRSSVPVESV